jgi:hypothetical protein
MTSVTEVTQVRFCKVWLMSSGVFSNGWQWATAIFWSLKLGSESLKGWFFSNGTPLMSPCGCLSGFPSFAMISSSSLQQAYSPYPMTSIKACVTNIWDIFSFLIVTHFLYAFPSMWALPTCEAGTKDSFFSLGAQVMLECDSIWYPGSKWFISSLPS